MVSFVTVAPFAFDIQADDYQIGAAIVAARDPAQKKLCCRIVDSYLRRFPLEFDRAS